MIMTGQSQVVMDGMTKGNISNLNASMFATQMIKHRLIGILVVLCDYKKMVFATMKIVKL